MGKVNVYLPDDLERLVRETGVPVSAICQAALRSAVDAVTSIRQRGGDLSELSSKLTPRLAAILATGPATALDLLGAIILHGENMGARVLADLGVELPAPRPLRKAKGAGERSRSASAEVRETLAAAYRIALELQHDYLGAEHMVIALAREDSPVAELFAALGIDERAARSRVVHLLTNPTRRGEPPAGEAPVPSPEVLDRFEAELRRMSDELAALRSSAKLRRWPPTTSS